MAQRRLHAVTFLAPNMLPVYRFMMRYLGDRLGCAVRLSVGSDYAEALRADLALICGLPYVLRTRPRAAESPIEALAAPVLKGERFQNRPIYFSDVIVHRDSRFQSFADLRGCSWAYNEPESQSGYGITRYHLAKLGATSGYFGQVVASGFHQRSIRMVSRREIDASAIDAQVLAIELRDHPRLARQIRIIDSLGPSTIQPLASSTRLPVSLRRDIQAILAEMHHDPAASALLDRGMIDHFVPVTDADYDDIRAMLAFCEQADYRELR